MKTIGKEWTRKEEGGTFTADHLSPSQLSKSMDIWFNDYIILTAKERKALASNLNMDIGAIVGQAVQDIIVHKLTFEEVMKDTVMMELAKMQTKIRTYENNEKKLIEQLHIRDDEISKLNKELDLFKLKDQMIAKNQSYLEAKAQKDIDQIKENQKIQQKKGNNETKATDDRRKK